MWPVESAVRAVILHPPPTVGISSTKEDRRGRSQEEKVQVEDSHASCEQLAT